MYFQRRNNRITVYYYCKKKGKVRALPRSETKHLDGMTEDAIREWMDSHPAAAREDRGRRFIPYTTDHYHQLFLLYQQERREDGVGERSLENESMLYYKYILPFFVGEHGAKDLRLWRKLGGRLRSHLSSTTGLSLKSIGQAIQMVNRWGRWLRDAGHIEDVWEFRGVRTKRNKATPLKESATPKDILSGVKNIKEDIWKLLVLVGYFGCLRPEESMALERQDFITGEEAISRSLTYDRLKKAGLGSKLALFISKAQTKNKEIGPPKNPNSNGVVTIWHPQAALQIAKLARTMPEGRLIDYTKRYVFTQFNEKARPHINNLTMHDLRRASGLYLGRSVGLDAFLLQDILRHADLETTQLYTRRNVRELDVSSLPQNFDDVV